MEFEGSKWVFREAVIGNIYQRPHFQLTYNADFISNGAKLGRLEYVIDLVDVNSAVFEENYALFITVIIFFVILVLFSNLGTLKTIFAMEKSIAETNGMVNRGEYAGIQASLSSLPQNLKDTPFAGLIEKLAEVLSRASKLEKDLAVSKAVSDLSAQVAHDIRSPLAALDAALKGFEVPPEQKELVNAATARIRGIAEDLLKKYKGKGLEDSKIRRLEKDEQKNKTTQGTDLAEIIESILMEKKAQYPDIVFTFEKPEKTILAETEPKEFARIISNLLNNSAEAITEENRDERTENSGEVGISIKQKENKIILSVKDNGKGIPPEILSRIGEKGFTHGKEGGNGLGLYHARLNIENWGGKLEIKSSHRSQVSGLKLETGTEIIIELPLPLTAVPWPPTAAILIDDDMLVRKNWELSAKKKGISLKIFKKAEDFLNTAGDFSKNAAIYIDSELENGTKGEEIAKKIYSLGFREIYLETGHPKENFKDAAHLKDIIGKEPPF